MEMKRTPPLWGGGIASIQERSHLGRDEDNTIRKKYHSRVTGLINAMWKSRRGGHVLALCVALRHTHIHAQPFPVTASPSLPLIPPQLTGGPFILIFSGLALWALTFHFLAHLG